MSRHAYQLPGMHAAQSEESAEGGSLGTWTAVLVLFVLCVSFVFFMTSPLLPWGKHSELADRITELENVVQMLNGTKRRRSSHEMPDAIDMRDTHAYINAAGIYLNGQPMRFTDLYDVNQQTITAGQPIVWQDDQMQTLNLTSELRKGASNGVAPLDANGLVPLQNLPVGTVSAVHVVPTLVERNALVANTGDCAVVLNVNGTGHREAYIWNSTAWVQLSDDLGVVSWNNHTGIVNVTTDDVPEGATQRYFTDQRVAAHANVQSALVHSQLTSGNPHGVTKADVGLGNVANTKNDLTAAAVPTAFSDVSSGFTPGSTVVVPTGAGSVWRATDTTIGLAKWKRVDGMLPPVQSSVVADAVARFDGTTGLLIKDSSVSITNGGNIVLAGLVDGRDVSADGVAADAHIGNAALHRQIDDVGAPASTTLWSSAKAATELLAKAGAVHAHVAADVSDFTTAVSAVIDTQKGAASGLATLDVNGKLPAAQLGLSALTVFKGTWNAATNSPLLLSLVCVAGDYYIVNTAGSTTLNGISSWSIGDWAMCATLNTWSRIASVSGVASVAGKTGTVTLVTGDIASGTFVDARISTSSVTQHQAALSITGTQIATNPALSGYVQLADVVEPSNGASGTGRLYKKQSSAGLFWKPDDAGAEVNLAAASVGLTLLEVFSVVEAVTTSIVYSPLPDITITPPAGTYKVDFSATVYMDEAKDAKAYFAMFVGGVVVPHTKRQLFLPSGHKHAFYDTVYMSAVVTVNGAQTIIVQFRCHAAASTLHVYERSMQLVK